MKTDLNIAYLFSWGVCMCLREKGREKVCVCVCLCFMCVRTAVARQMTVQPPFQSGLFWCESVSEGHTAAAISDSSARLCCLSLCVRVCACERERVGWSDGERETE